MALGGHSAQDLPLLRAEIAASTRDERRPEKRLVRSPPALRQHAFEAEFQKPADSLGPNDSAAGRPREHFGG
jgi:hypothetical protein